jgi:hypothetical protein
MVVLSDYSFIIKKNLTIAPGLGEDQQLFDLSSKPQITYIAKTLFFQVFAVIHFKHERQQ